MEYEVVIGLEVHVQLKTKTKAFCGCSTEFGQNPNSQTCPVCLGFPGSLPVLNKAALDSAIKVGLALNCQVQPFTKFDRKHYYYPDLPKNYQISQYDLPISKDGFLDIEVDGKPIRIGITRVHLEEDAGKLLHKDDLTLVDLNRTGIPLLEIVSYPDMHSPQEAFEYLTSLKSIVEYLDVSDCDMEKGSLRCDANISIRPKGAKELGTKAELKNMNSFKAVKDALAYEVERQIDLVNAGERVIQETRLWDTKELKTFAMRSKEEARDYRYFPEPDLPPFLISAEKISEIKNTIPELPKAKIARLIKEYGLLESDAKILVFSKKGSDYAEGILKKYPGQDKKTVVNWLIGPILSEAKNRNCAMHELQIPGDDEELIGLVQAVAEGRISNLAAKSVLNESLTSGVLCSQIIINKNLIQISDSGSLSRIIDEVINENPKSVADFKSGKENALMFLTGQCMKKSQGKANPKVLQELLRQKL